ncbi:uncharacterized protein K02A2.6-like [Amphibalanus amphitrite]|uniref:uncharacterized protein K02A2.6-like n=1 Tax=Amphibalanus amphitrite TaxID=1232801 RepID=UPI001C922732|nr:uncharacterized protein K02A2.6-like [Amphibalanus amphitrite]XP_043224265.1 uncharacterized protein K02A2.6-like [Amphibalanus amphitrite]
MTVTAKYQEQEHTVSLLVVDVDSRRPNLMGRDWLKVFRLDWKSFATMNMVEKGDIQKQYPEVFLKGKGPIKSFKVEVKLKEGATPGFFKPRSVPYALRTKVTEELDRLVNEGILVPVTSSEWASPIVTVMKQDGTVRLCGDYKVTVNRWAEVGTYPLPTVQDLFAKIKGKVFSKLDLSQAYLQCELSEASKRLLVINTPRGLLQPQRLPYGVAQAPELFQKVMDQALQGLDGVLVYLDDILVASSSVEEHRRDLSQVMERLEKYNIHLNGAKCEMFKTELDYLGHRITADGIHPTEEKIQAIRNMKRPDDVKELQSMLGIINFYRRFLPNLSTQLQPLNQLLQKEARWNWTPACEKVFQQLKSALSEDDVLVHYDEEKPIKLSCDASSYGLGAVISHVMSDGSERPIAFASRTMTSTERNYAQVEREGLSIMFGLKKFHQYLYGRLFTLVTDHQALTSLLGPHTAVPPLAAARMQRWALMLAAYSYKIEYRRSDLHGNADALSRLVTNRDNIEDPDQMEEEPVFSVVEELPLTAQEIKEETRRDLSLTLGKVVVTDNGPTFTSSEFSDFLKRNGVKHKRTPPYHSASNGQVERCVRTLKENLLKNEVSGEKRTLRHQVDSFLFAYRNTPHTVTGKTPAELFLRRAPRTRLSLLKPNLKAQVEKMQEQQKASHDGKDMKLREFTARQPVFVRNCRSDQRVT